MASADHQTMINQWVDHYTDDLFAYAFHKTSNRELAEDLTQDAFLAAFQSLGNFRKDSSPKTWLFSILRNKISDHFRKQFRQPVMTSFEDDRGDSWSPFDEHERWQDTHAPISWNTKDLKLLDDVGFVRVFNNCLDALPENWRMALWFKFFSTKKGPGISQELGMSTTNYWQVVHRAKLQLRACLEKKWFIR